MSIITPARTGHRGTTHAGAAGVAALADLVSGLAHTPELWRPALLTLDRERTGVHLLETEALDVWLLGWPPGTRVDPHDHGVSAGAFTVVEGTLTEVRWSAAPRVRVLGPGEVVTIPAGVVHDVVAAPDPAGAAALSIHAYSPPLRTMGFYDDDGARLIAGVTVDPSQPHW